MAQHSAQNISFILFAVLLVVIGSWAQTPPVTFIPTLYVTSAPERPTPLQAFIYQANVCNTTIYQGNMVIARVNIPSGWNPNIGRVAKLQVCTTSDCSTCLCTNYPGGKFNGQHNCSFTYNKSLTPVYIVVTAGNAPNIDWTVALEFLPKSQYVEKDNEELLFYEMLEFPEPIAINKVSDTDVKTLQQIVPPGNNHNVSTMQRRDFRFAFCPDAATTPRYNVDIIVIARDSRSAMATYVCLPPVDPNVGCLPGEAEHSDPRGIAINVVTVPTGTGSLKDVYVAVVGWGDGYQDNNFLIGATITRIT